MAHPELQHHGKNLKQFFITTGLGIAYMNEFSVEIYNIQKPCKENVVLDYTHEYFTKVLTQRRLNVKKAERAAAKQEKTLASLIKSAREKAAETQPKSQTPEEVLQSLKDNMQKSVRSFQFPY